MHGNILLYSKVRLISQNNRKHIQSICYNKLNNLNTCMQLKQQKKALYLLMSSQSSRNHILALMSECLQLLRQLPSTLQHLHKQNSKQSLMQLTETSIKFNELGQITENWEQMGQCQNSLFHRFGCKVIDVANLCQSHSVNVLVRQFFMGVAERISQIKVGTKSKINGVSRCFFDIGLFIDGFINKIMILQKLPVSQSTILQITTARKTHKKTTTTAQQVKSTIQDTRQSIAIPLKNKEQNLSPLLCKKINRSNSQNDLTMKIKQRTIQLGLNDLDVNYLEKVNNNQVTPDQMYEQCMNRNRFISQLMRQYQLKYDVYAKKPQHKRNRQHSYYHPTSMDKNISKPAKRLKKSKTKKTELSHSQPPKPILLDSQTRTQILQLKQSLINQVYNYQRKQYIHINRIKIGQQQQQTPLHFALDFPNIKYDKHSHRTIDRKNSKIVHSQRINGNGNGNGNWNKTQRMKTFALNFKNSSCVKDERWGLEASGVLVGGK